MATEQKAPKAPKEQKAPKGGALLDTEYVQTVNATAVVQTDAPGYILALQQNQDLTNGGTSISPITGDIGTPALWTMRMSVGDVIGGMGVSGTSGGTSGATGEDHHRHRARPDRGPRPPP